MIKEIGDLVLDLFRIRILGRNHDLGCFLSYFFQDLIDSLIEKIIRVRTFFWMYFPILNRLVNTFKYLKRVGLVVIVAHHRLEETGRIAGMAGYAYLIHLCE